MGASTSTMGWLRRCWLGVLVAMGLVATPSAAGATTTVALEKPLATIYYMHAGACASTLDAKSHPTYNLPSGVSATGIAFDGAGNLYVSCWGDNTIDQINIATRSETVYRISGGTGFGALTYHGGVLWACNGHTDGVGTIQLNASAHTGVFTSAFTAANSACTDALAFDPSDSTGNTIWMGTDVGNTPGQTGKTLDKFVSGRLSASKSVAGTIGHRSGIVATRTSFVLAQPVGGPNSIFQLYQSTSRTLANFTEIASWSGGRLRPEDLECDASTFPGKTVVWVAFARRDMTRAYQITGTCG